MTPADKKAMRRWDCKVMSRAFALCIKDLRHARGLSQERFALESGIDRVYMSGLEREEHVPSVEMMYRCLPTLKMSFAEFAAEFDKWVKTARRTLKAEEKKT
jgi:transcriptional regulator with XRE-family HTH domain